MAVEVVNLVLCVVIVLLALLGYNREKDKVPLFIGIAFAIFGLQWLLAMVGMDKWGSWENIQIIISVVAYLLVIIALYVVVLKRKKT